ncbi:2-phosphosulfolactate phosphatase [Aeoliella sp. ICT_H6.2]|uniref:Probable 2-phosphosulfolactate phosphatase n=1 Tax=Aeoliella straminimaris TaxID=2954799 RepID=A0A9X2JHP1_9BACT|nr:2-phosphosulfolactate phosphatase [Aeoliella straminimaris]MCO6045657.1 2-phosphosulfolactate phosphatase [Aeoliella straminimaris]
MPELHVHYLPHFVREHDLAESTVVVIDQLRASSTVCHALAAGARDVVPFQEVDDVLTAAGDYNRADVLMGGERGGERIDSFDLGNSPSEYTADVVFGKRVLFTTTNGTRAINHARLASRVIMGAAANLTAVCDAVSSDAVVHLLCAGTNGHVSRDDLLIAGAMAHELSQRGQWVLNEGAQATRGEWQELLNAAVANARSPSEQLAIELCDTPGGKNLLAIGHDEDLVVCAQIDSKPVVPELDRDAGCLKLP